MAGGSTVVIDRPQGLVSSGNASTTPLSGGATYTGAGEQNFYPDVMASCYSDVAGTLYFDFSINGTDWLTLPSSGFAVAAGVHKLHTEVKGPRHFRCRFVNGASAQSTFQLQVYYGSFRATNTPLNQSIANDSDATIVRTVSSDIDLALGRFSGFTEDAKFGLVTGIDAADSEVDIWAMANDTFANRLDQKTFPTSAATLYMASDDNADTAEVTVEYLDSSGELQTVTADLNGNTPVNLGVTGLDSNRAYLSGDNQTAAGNIYITNDSAFTSGVPDTLSSTLAFIPAGYGHTQQCLYQVPTGKICRVKKAIVTISRASGAAGSAEIHVIVKKSGGSWRVLREWNLSNGNFVKEVAGIVLNAGDLIRFTVPDVSDTGTNITGEFHYDLVDA